MASAAAAARLLHRQHHRHLLLPNSHLSSTSSSADGLDDGCGGRVKIFDRNLKHRHRDRRRGRRGRPMPSRTLSLRTFSTASRTAGRRSPLRSASAACGACFAAAVELRS